MLNLLTIDLEDYFMVSAFEGVVKREDWKKYESRIERNTYRLLEMLNNAPGRPVTATFFCIGRVAEEHPQLIREIRRQGHEVACHSYDHRRIYDMTPGEFREDIRKSKRILEDVIGAEVIGYRAPSYSITDKSVWAFEILHEEGFKYDSSVFPIHHDIYGMPRAPRFPFIVSLNGNKNFEFSMLKFESNDFSNSNLITQNSTSSIQNLKLNIQNSRLIVEFPLSTVKVFGHNFPVSGGGYFRLFPYSLIRRALTRINEKEQKPFIFYIHPWELDFGQPRIKEVSLRSRFRHYVNLDKTEFRLKTLLSDFQFLSIRELLTQIS